MSESPTKSPGILEGGVFGTKPAEPAPKAKKPGPTALADIDIEGSGLNVDPNARFNQWTPRDADEYGEATVHQPGSDPDCILEVSLVVLNIEKEDNMLAEHERTYLVERHRQSWLVLPPGVDTVEKFDVWADALAKTNPFAFSMHTKAFEQPIETMVVPEGEEAQAEADKERWRGSLLGELRKLAGAKNKPADPIAWVEEEIVKVLRSFSALPRRASEKWHKEHPESPVVYGLNAVLDLAPAFDWDKPGAAHPGVNDILMCGNSIANYDIPMLRLWMPAVIKSMSYRTLDVSVMRSFYQDIADVDLPEYIAKAIKTGSGLDGRESNHRALDDALFAAESLHALISFAQMARTPEDFLVEIGKIKGQIGEQFIERMKHLEVLIRYGSKRAIAEERDNIIKAENQRNIGWGPDPRDPYRDNGGIFKRSTGGVLKATAADLYGPEPSTGVPAADALGSTMFGGHDTDAWDER